MAVFVITEAIFCLKSSTRNGSVDSSLLRIHLKAISDLSNMSRKTALVLLYPLNEENEIVIPVQVLRKAEVS